MRYKRCTVSRNIKTIDLLKFNLEFICWQSVINRDNSCTCTFKELYMTSFNKLFLREGIFFNYNIRTNLHLIKCKTLYPIKLILPKIFIRNRLRQNTNNRNLSFSSDMMTSSNYRRSCHHNMSALHIIVMFTAIWIDIILIINIENLLNFSWSWGTPLSWYDSNTL